MRWWQHLRMQKKVNWGDEETVRLCMAASAGAVTTIGTKPPSGELIDRLKEQVIIEEIQ